MTTDTIKLGEAQTLRVVASSAEALEMESTWTAGGKQPRTHWHPNQHEHFEVLEGELTVELGDEPPQILQPGETIDIPPQTAHRMWNAGPGTARASWRVSPPQRTEEMFRLIDRGISPLKGVRMLWTFRHEIRLGQKTPR